MSFTGKLSAGMSIFAQSMKNGTDNCKLEGKISEQEKRIKEMTKEIGNLVLLRLDAGDLMSPEIMERYEMICEARDRMESYGREKKVTKAVCPVCGAKTSLGMKYCGVCGASMEETELEEA